ncbi:hypothetical protein [Verminephrobacter eiseniae]|uniref:hypothetical protein n=1 Tax=Verminephrobacter eiseniae TaxID=364317 RepID=UPI0012EE6D5E|nr:hypothetical protein [Verminephrobacter eiseniae]
MTAQKLEAAPLARCAIARSAAPPARDQREVHAFQWAALRLSACAGRRKPRAWGQRAGSISPRTPGRDWRGSMPSEKSEKAGLSACRAGVTCPGVDPMGIETMPQCVAKRPKPRC